MPALLGGRTITLRESGCISYRFGFALDEPDALILVEERSDEESLAAHLASAHFATFSDVLRSALRGRRASLGTT